MDLLFQICVGISAGVLAGFLLGGIKVRVHKKEYSEAQREKGKLFVQKISSIVKYITIVLLVIGLVWCVYFLLMALILPERADYANNMAELIVAVLTVISIIFAFVEFTRHQK